MSERSESTSGAGATSDAAAEAAAGFIAWSDACTAIFLAALDRVSDDALLEPSALPGWSRAKLAAHVHRNAEALRRLTAWARTGNPTPMYASVEQRDRDIEVAALWAPVDLRASVRRSSEDLAADFDALDPGRWGNEVVTATGRGIPASQIAWLRVREVAIHAVDLDTGTDFPALPAPVLSALIEDVVAFRHRRGTDPAVRLAVDLAVDDGEGWLIGAEPRVTVTGDPALLAAWLTGRSAGDGLDVRGAGAVPTLGPWL